MTDSAFLYHILEDGKWHGQAEILRRSIDERGHGLTVHSRAADIRKKVRPSGFDVECELRGNGHGRVFSYYRLVALDEPEAAIGGTSSGSSSVPDPASELPSSPTGTLFACEIDESAGLRGAYWDDAA